MTDSLRLPFENWQVYQLHDLPQSCIIPGDGQRHARSTKRHDGETLYVSHLWNV